MTNNPIVKGKLVCVALNDSDQFEAMQAEFNEAPYKSAPTQPVLYFKPHNTWSTDGAEVEWAADADSMVVGASLAVVFGKECCRVSPEEALDYVGGYTLVHDFSLPEKSYYRPDIKGKCLDGTAPIGATVVPASDVADPQALAVVTKVNGEVVNEMPLSRTVRGVAELISTISYIMTLQPGEVIAVAFPGDRAPVNKGDKVTSEIAGVVALNNQMGQ
ncbi:fumarylacetoacetate hydrolase family protein [Neptuniibacter sp.]|uniref:fumarylacetoacetate hydrolase family protein n=1 Tax=Neptuniibacter sp. TaxID=1962643 RepID=UPI0026331032|nr:fumarylacetoacetate hydrolase family protein [Neptuniibacter sp.]MCP4597658.1 5-carboxymethyl-2-oxo-hex-3- ene-1,7-dioate decarboxylase [Neptuniibacter sp.]